MFGVQSYFLKFDIRYQIQSWLHINLGIYYKANIRFQIQLQIFKHIYILTLLHTELEMNQKQAGLSLHNLNLCQLNPSQMNINGHDHN